QAALDIRIRQRYFVDKAETASAAPALKIFCSVLHRKRCLHKIWDITVYAAQFLRRITACDSYCS
ncbi:MAG: hypothetical protein SPG84_07620, partial [Vescimonas sp.]|uniref:hypothetical protein n=1 Tax=Vescimonas sp. TaxID=2892404 RepID=UPI002A9125A9